MICLMNVTVVAQSVGCAHRLEFCPEVYLFVSYEFRIKRLIFGMETIVFSVK
jgi:hypothetical protein